MKNYFNIILVAVFLLTACGQRSDNAQISSLKNAEIAALDSIHQNFLQLSQHVDSISAHLSPIEQERAAFFMLSAYSLAIQAYVERGNPGEPALTDWMTSPRKFAGDNPYTIYTQAPVTSEFAYKLSGKKGTAIYLGLQVYSYKDGFNLPSSNIGLKNIKFNKDETFEIYLSAEKPAHAVNWVPLKTGDHTFLVRQYFDKRTGNVPAELKIERIDQNPSKGTTYLQRLRHTNKIFTDFIMGTIEVCKILEEDAFNQYPAKDAQVQAPKYGGALYPTKDNRYRGCWMSLQKGEAMQIHGTIPQNTLYASYVFYDRWYNTPTYPKINCFRIKDEIVLNADGTFDLYISPEKIDHPNWLNTGGLYEGSYSSRYLESTDTIFPTIKIVKIADIK